MTQRTFCHHIMHVNECLRPSADADMSELLSTNRSQKNYNFDFRNVRHITSLFRIHQPSPSYRFYYDTWLPVPVARDVQPAAPTSVHIRRSCSRSRGRSRIPLGPLPSPAVGRQSVRSMSVETLISGAPQSHRQQYPVESRFNTIDGRNSTSWMDFIGRHLGSSTATAKTEHASCT